RHGGVLHGGRGAAAVRRAEHHRLGRDDGGVHHRHHPGDGVLPVRSARAGLRPGARGGEGLMGAAERIERAAASVLMPGFLGTEPPPWLARAVRGGLGSVLYFGQNFTGDTARLSAELHRLAPGLLIASDEEGGAVSRLHAGGPAPYPSHAELGAADDTDRTREVARALGEELAGVGVDAALSPVVDVNSDPLNPVI